MADELLRGEVHAFAATAGTDPGVPNVALAGATWTELGEDLITDDAVTLSHSETVDDEMVLNQTVAIDNFRTVEEWMLNFSIKDFTAPNLQRVLNGNAITTVAPGTGMVGYLRVPLRKGVAVAKQAITVRIDDSPYRVAGDNIRTQITFLNASHVGGWESVLGPKQQGAMVPFSFKGLLDATTSEVGYVDLTNAPAT